jgi:DNA-binding SARP family transcriptional activator
VSAVGELHLRVLGELEIARGDARLPLPPSKKTRALLAYLALTGRAHRRERLCALLWDVTDDPRGALRWSLSRLRALVDEPDTRRIVADRESVSLDRTGLEIDLFAARATATRLDREGAAVGVDELERAAGAFRGELLEGLDLADFDEFCAWCVAEREEARRLQARLARALIAWLAADPERALPHARTLVGVEPLDDAARVDLVRMLAAVGRLPEA